MHWLRSIANKSLAEFIGCMMFHFIGSISPTPWANGISLMNIVYYVANISGGHLNPAVSWVFMALGYITPWDMLFYWTAQVMGCAVGALWIWALVPELYLWQEVDTYNALAHSGCFVPKLNLSHARIFGWEAICTLCFLLPIFSVVWYTTHKSGYGNTGPIMIGLALIANALVAGPFTGAALNPARVLGSAIVFECPRENTMHLYILGQMAAAIVAPFFLIPWYGIAKEAWYLSYLPARIYALFKKNQPSIALPA